jgi:hypothetical protein
MTEYVKNIFNKVVDFCRGYSKEEEEITENEKIAREIAQIWQELAKAEKLQGPLSYQENLNLSEHSIQPLEKQKLAVSLAGKPIQVMTKKEEQGRVSPKIQKIQSVIGKSVIDTLQHMQSLARCWNVSGSHIIKKN